MIPKEAKQLGKELKHENIDKWWCPDCGANGDSKNIDFIPVRKIFDDSEMVQYCCSECFEENIYATFINE